MKTQNGLSLYLRLSTKPLFLSLVIALSVDMVSCSSQDPAYSGSSAAAQPLHANGFILPLVQGWEAGTRCTQGAYLSSPGSVSVLSKPTPPFTDSICCASLCDWDPDVGKRFPCSPSWLGIINLRVKKKNAISIQMHPSGRKSCLWAWLLQKVVGFTHCS